MKYQFGTYCEEISERNHKFKCKDCGKAIYGKKCKYDLHGNTRIMCLKCFVEYYENTRNTGFKKTIKKIKQKYKLDLVVEEL